MCLFANFQIYNLLVDFGYVFVLGLRTMRTRMWLLIWELRQRHLWGKTSTDEHE